MITKQFIKIDCRVARKLFPLFISIVCIATMIGLSNGQTFNFDSGSTGVNGAFPPGTVPGGTTAITINLNDGEVLFLPGGTTVILPNTPAGGFIDGVFNFTTVNVPSGITLSFIKHTTNPPVTILATGDIIIDGTIDISGKRGEIFKLTGVFSLGGEGGPGGFNGGNGGFLGLTSNIGGAGLGPGGALPGNVGMKTGGATYGASNSFDMLIPLFGGSGGGGGFGDSRSTGSGGGGGGGAILIASSNITINGTINASGGDGGKCKSINVKDEVGTGGGGGSGGAIKIVANIINGAGSLIAVEGIAPDSSSCSFSGDIGRIRLEAFVHAFSGTINPSPSVSISPGAVTTTSNPALAGVPTLTISSVGGINAPVVTTGNLSVPDLSLPQGTTNPLDVILKTDNIPVGTVFTVRVAPQFGNATDVSSTASADTGNPGKASATAQISLPVGEIVMLSAFADFSIQTAGLYPQINGEEIKRIMVSANFGEKSQLTLVTESGKALSPDKLINNRWVTLK